MTRGRSALLGAALALAPGAAQADEPGAGFEVERYAVELRPDLATTAVSGRETIRIAATADDVRAVAFSPNALTIADARVGGAPVTVTPGDGAITFALPRPLKRGERATLTFTFAGTPARGVSASPAGVHSGYFACDWMVCLQDAPGDKADMTLTCSCRMG